MPSVPRYESQVRLQPIGGQKVTGDIAPEAFGGQIAQAQGRMAGVLDDAAEALQRRRDRMDETAVKQLDTEFTAFERETLYGESGYFRTQGRQAVLQSEGVEKALRDRAAELIGRTQGRQQKELLEGALNQRLASTLDGVARYRLKAEEEDYAATSNARMSTYGELAAASFIDPETQKQALATGLAELEDLAQHYGWSDDVHTAKKLEWLSGVHGAVIAQLINDDPMAAQTYYDAHLGDMDAKTRALYGARLSGAVTRRQAAVRGLAAWDGSGGNAAVAYSLVSDLPPEQRIEAEQIIDSQAARAERLDAEAREDAYISAAGMIAQGAQIAAIPPDVLAKIPDRLGSLASLASAVSAGTEPAKGGSAYLLALAQSAEDPAAFKQTDILSLAGTMHPDELAELLKAQRSMRQGAEKTPQVKGYELAWGIAAPLAAAYGADSTSRGRTKLSEIKASIMADVQARIAAGDKIDEKVAAEIVRLAFLPSASTANRPQSTQQLFAENRPGRSRVPTADALKTAAPQLWDRTTFALRVHHGSREAATNTAVAEAMAYYEATGYRAMVPYKEIPEETRKAYEDMMRRRGLQVSRADVERAYTEELLQLSRE